MFTELKEEYNMLKRLEFDSRDELRLVQLVRMSYLTNTFYGVDLNNFKDFLDIELLNKEKLMNYKPDDISNLIKATTSGSTGVPFTFYRPISEQTVKHAVFMVAWEALGWNRKDKVLRLVAGRPSYRIMIEFLTYNIKMMNYRTIGMNSARWIVDKNPFLVHGTVGAQRIILSYLTKIHKSHVLEKSISVLTSESPEQHLDYITPYYKEVYQNYGLSECPTVAFECPEHKLHINMLTCYVESIDGELYITNLMNDQFPFIRYATGDKGEVKTINCKCGRHSDIIVGLEGKSIDFYDGDEVKTPVSWWLVSPIGRTKEYQECVKQWSASIFPKDKLFILYIIPSDNANLQQLTPYLDWVERKTGLSATFKVVDEVSRKKLSVVE